MLNSENTAAVIAGHQCVLLALVGTHPNRLALFQAFRAQVVEMRAVLESESPEFVTQFDQLAKDLETAIR